MTEGGKDVNVYIFDTGVGLTHSRFQTGGATNFEDMQDSKYVDESMVRCYEI